MWRMQRGFHRDTCAVGKGVRAAFDGFASIIPNRINATSEVADNFTLSADHRIGGR